MSEQDNKQYGDNGSGRNRRTRQSTHASNPNGGHDMFDQPNRAGEGQEKRKRGLRTIAPGSVGDIRGFISGRAKESKPHEPSALTKLVTEWANRLLGVAHDRSFHEQGAQYEANKTSRDFLWNSIGMGAWGVVFPVLTIVVTQLSGAEQAGMFSMAFVVASLLMILANFGIRTFQISDVNEEYSFADYRINRLITCVLAVVAGAVYCNLRGYDDFMATMAMGLVVYKTVDGFADVYEGRLQQCGKMYLAGVSQTVRSLLVFVIFCIALLITGSLPVASVAMAVVAVLTLGLVSLPLAHMETPRSRPVSMGGVLGLFKHSWPLFAALFMYALIDNMPKFVMEGALSYDNQLYYNALYFPAMFILMTAQTVYKPMLVSMAQVWHDPEKRRRFDLIFLAVVALIVVLTVVMAFVMMTVGLQVMGFLYGMDFMQFEKISIIMLVAGGITAGIDFLYQTVTILRRQKEVMIAYVIALVLSLFTPMLLIEFAKLEGAALSYLIVMVVLFILMLWIYFRMRFTRAGRESLQADQEAAMQEAQGNVERPSAVSKNGVVSRDSARSSAGGENQVAKSTREGERRTPTRRVKSPEEAKASRMSSAGEKPATEMTRRPTFRK